MLHSRNIEKLNALSDIPEQGDFDDHLFYHTHRGAKQPLRLTFQVGVQSYSLRWALSDCIQFNGSDTIVMEFVSRIVTIKGRGLNGLCEALDREKVTYITKVENPPEDMPEYVENISVELRK